MFVTAINLIRPKSVWAAASSSWRLRHWSERGAWEMPLIHISSNAVFERPLTKYGLSKIVQEAILRDRAFIVRVPHLYGDNPTSPCVFDRWLFNNEQEIVVRDPERDIDFLPINSFVWFIETILKSSRVKAGQSLNIGSGQRQPLLAWAMDAARTTGKQVRIDSTASPHTRLLSYSAVTIQEALEWLNPIQSTIGVPA